MTPDYYDNYDTAEYVSSLTDKITEGKTAEALNFTYRTMPTDSSTYRRVVNLSNQYRQAEIRMYDGLPGWREEMSRINLAVLDVLEELRREYPYSIPLRTEELFSEQDYSPAQLTYEEDEDYFDYEEEQVYHKSESSGIGLGAIIAILLLVVTSVALLAKSSSDATAGTSTIPLSVGEGIDQIGWVLLLKEGKDCTSLADQYDFVFRHHDDAEVVSTSRGGCALLIRFPDQKSAKARKKKSTSLKRTFPNAKVINL